MKKVALFFAFTFLFITHLLAQQSIKKLVQLGDEALQAHHYQSAIEYFSSAESKAPNDANVKYQLAECYRYTFQYQDAEKYYQQVKNLKSKNLPLALFYLALTQKMNNKYSEAIKTFDEFIQSSLATRFVGRDEIVAQAKLEKEGCMLAIERSSLPFRSFGLTHLPSPINTEFNEYAAYNFQHDTCIVITSSRTESTGKEEDTSFGEGFTDCFRFTKETGTWAAFQKDDDFDKTNADFHEGSGSFNHNFSSYYFTRCEGPECAIFVTRFQNGKWLPEERLNDNINPKGTESKHPNLSITGDTLFFVSNRPGGIGGNDVYMSIARTAGQWGTARNLGNKINTNWNEGSPYYFSKEKILVIASQGHAGYGGFDIFLVKDPFGNPVVENIGKPFNSETDDLYFMAGSKKGYLTSNRPGGSGNFDIYTFDMRSEESMIAAIENKPEVTEEPPKVVDDKILGSVSTFNLTDLDNISISGNLVDCLTSNPLEGIEVQLMNEQGEVVKITTSNGLFRYLNISMNQNYKVVVKGKTISLLDKRDVCVKNLKVDGSKHAAVTSTFENIYFDFNKTTLRPEAEKALQELARMYKSNPAIQVEIDGFTDDIGADAYNNKLSLQRGNKTAEYLIRQGTDRASLVIIAKGEGSPAASNQTPSGRQLNRRIEFKIKGGELQQIAQTYIIESKMTLYSLSKKYNTTVDELKRLNGLQSDHIEVNRPLRIPAGLVSSFKNTSSAFSTGNTQSARSYTVKKGDTIFSIVVGNNMTVERFKELNSLSNNFIRKGQIVKVEPRY